MQTRIKQIFFLAVPFLFILTSCSKSNKEGRHIPVTALFAMHINGASITEKLPWETIRENAFFKEAYSDSANTAFIRSIMDNPENSGIDVKSDLIIFAAGDSAGNYIAVEGKVKDPEKFKKFNTELNPNQITSENNGTSFYSTEKMTAAINNGQFILVANAPGKTDFIEEDSTVTENSNTGINKRDLKAIAILLFDLKENKSLGKDEIFTNLMKKDADMHIWMNIEEIGMGAGKDMSAMAAMSMINLKKIMEGSRVTASVQFENGKISADINSYSGKEMTALVKKYSGDKINSEMIKMIPQGKIGALFALNFKPEGIGAYLKLLGVDGFANMGTAFLGFNLDDFIKANKGDILLAVTDIQTDSMGKPDASVIFSASIGDKKSFEKLIDAGKKLLSKESNPSIAFNMNEKYFAISNKKQLVDQYFKPNGGTAPAFFDKISGSSSAVYLDFQYILNSMQKTAQEDSVSREILKASLKTWETLLITSNGNNNNGSSQHVEINFMDKKTNSLQQLNSYISTLALLKKQKDEEKAKNIAEDLEALNATAINFK